MILCSDKGKLTRVSVAAIIQQWNDLTGPTKERKDGCVTYVANQASRALIRSWRPCWIGKINLYGDMRGKKECILEEYKSGKVYNFSCSFIIPQYDEELVRLILERDTSEYTTATDDGKKVDVIFARIEELGGTTLHWE